MPRYRIEMGGYVEIDAATVLDAEDEALELITGNVFVDSHPAEVAFVITNSSEVDYA